MKQFFKFTLASALGYMLASGVSMIFGMLLVVGILAGGIATIGGEQQVEVKENSLLTIDLSQAVVDRATDNPLANFNPNTFKSEPKLGLNNILEGLENAASDDRIKGIYLDMSGVAAGLATTNEIRDAIADFKEESGKFVVAYSEGYSQKAYYLSSVADEIWLNPEGMVEFQGLGAQVMFMKDMLSKLEIEPQIIRYGKFKSAVEPLMLDKMSEANREQTDAFIGSLWTSMLETIGEARGLSVDELNRYADEALIRNADSAMLYKLVDKLVYKDEVLADLKGRLEIEEDDDIESIGIGSYAKAGAEGDEEQKKGSYKKDRIAVIYASGGIESGNGDHETIGSERISKAIRKARRDEKVKAIVLRVNSPGGSALASDVIWRETVLAKAEKPVIVSMGDVAASGGYYIACAADKILASPTTITGSIGVFGVLMNMKGLMNNKLGINIDTVKTNKFADIGSPFRPLTEQERELIQEGVNEIYFDFINKVGEGRGMASADVDSIGQGRVWAGTDALDIKLIDEYGGLSRAVEVAAEMAELEDYKLKEYPEQKDPIEEIIAEFTGQNEQAAMKEQLGPLYPIFKDFKTALEMEGVQARMPYNIYLD